MSNLKISLHQKLLENTGVLITNLGTPTEPTPTAVKKYLKEFLSDRRVIEIPRLLWWPILHGFILPFRSRSSAKAYEKIWQKEGSPLRVITEQQANGLQKILQEKYGDKIIVAYAMRYGTPSIEEQLCYLKKQSIKRLIVLPLYPQYSATTTASTFDAVAKVLKNWRYIPETHFINQYYDNPLYIEAISQSIQTYWAQHPRSKKLLISFHGLPKRNFELGDPYYCFCHKTARLIAESLQLSSEQWALCFQSRFGKAEWLQPYTDATLIQCAKEGIESVDIICPGFAADCLETLEEISIRYREVFLEAGGKQFQYI
ncbi:MAG: ferrochelatase, partial [Proteobacteria bacterium]|nr:ferrochelatase [Pseudomonadota bacterium]